MILSAEGLLIPASRALPCGRSRGFPVPPDGLVAVGTTCPRGGRLAWTLRRKFAGISPFDMGGGDKASDCFLGLAFKVAFPTVDGPGPSRWFGKNNRENAMVLQLMEIKIINNSFMSP